MNVFSHLWVGIALIVVVLLCWTVMNALIIHSLGEIKEDPGGWISLIVGVLCWCTAMSVLLIHLWKVLH